MIDWEWFFRNFSFLTILLIGKLFMIVRLAVMTGKFFDFISWHFSLLRSSEPRLIIDCLKGISLLAYALIDWLIDQWILRFFIVSFFRASSALFQADQRPHVGGFLKGPTGSGPQLFPGQGEVQREPRRQHDHPEYRDFGSTGQGHQHIRDAHSRVVRLPFPGVGARRPRQLRLLADCQYHRWTENAGGWIEKRGAFGNSAGSGEGGSHFGSGANVHWWVTNKVTIGWHLKKTSWLYSLIYFGSFYSILLFRRVLRDSMLGGDDRTVIGWYPMTFLPSKKLWAKPIVIAVDWLIDWFVMAWDSKIDFFSTFCLTFSGADIPEVDLHNVQTFCTRVTNLAEYRLMLQNYLKTKMQQCAPNLAALIGEQVRFLYSWLFFFVCRDFYRLRNVQ